MTDQMTDQITDQKPNRTPGKNWDRAAARTDLEMLCRKTRSAKTGRNSEQDSQQGSRKEIARTDSARRQHPSRAIPRRARPRWPRQRPRAKRRCREVPNAAAGDDGRGGKAHKRPRVHEQRTRIPIEQQLQRNQEIIVEIAKEPMGTKGARLTSSILVARTPSGLHADQRPRRRVAANRQR